VDPLSEKYAYQSHYNFSENRVVDARELEGLEKVQVNEEKPILDRFINGVSSFLSGVSNYISEKTNIGREIQTNQNPSVSGDIMKQKSFALESASSKMLNGVSETVKGSMYAVGETLDKGGEHTSNAALAAAPFTEGASLSIIPVSEGVSNFGFTLKLAVDVSDKNVSNILTEGSKKLISIGIGKLSDIGLDKVYKQTPILTQTQKAVHETAIKGTATVVSKAAEKIVDEKAKK